MKRYTLILLLAFSAAAQQPNRRMNTAPRQAAPAPQTKPEDLCTVEGMVSNASTGEALGKAKITLRRMDLQGPARNSYGGTSDTTGKFTITGVEPGRYRLAASRTGFVDVDYGARDYLQSGTPFTLDPRQHMGNVQLRMTPHGVITGRVVDEDGEPMQGVSVQAVRLRYMQGRRQLMQYGSASTNDIGEYRIYGLPPGRYFVAAAPRRAYMFDRGGMRPAARQPEEEYVTTYYAGTTDPAAAAPSELGPGAQLTGIDLKMTRRRTVRVRGHITDASGATPGRQRLMVSLQPHGLSGPGGNHMAAASANGDFEISGVGPGSYTLLAALNGRGQSLTAKMPVEVGNADVENVAITIHPPITLSGHLRVDGQTDASLDAIRVNLRRVEQGGPGFTNVPPAKLEPDGSFSLPNISPDQYRLTLSGLPAGFYVKALRIGDRDALTAGLDLTNGAAAALDIVLSPNAGVAGGLVQNEQQQPAAGVTVVAIPQETGRKDQPQYYKTAVTDDTGHFTLTSLDPGQYKIYAWRDIEGGAYMDPDFLKPVESHGEGVVIREGGQETVQVRLIE